MLALIRIFKNLRNREHFLRTRYHKEHPHFLLYIALDAIVTVTLVGGVTAFTYASGVSERNPHTLFDLGLATMAESRLKDQAHEHGGDMYWVGPTQNAKYTTKVLTPGVVKIGYVAADDAANEAFKPYISIETHNDPLHYRNATRGPIHETANISAINSMGNEITYNPADLQEVTVNLLNVQKIVVIKFAAPQTVGELLKASEKLHSVV